MSERTSKYYARYVLFAMVILYTLNVTDRYIASGLLERIKLSFDVSDTYMGFLIGPAFAFVYTVLAIPIARYADRHNRVKIICTGAVLWSLFTVSSGLATTPEAFALSRLGVGVGEAAFLAPAFSLLSDYFPARQRALAFAVLNFGVYFGQIVGLMGGAAIADAYDWRTAFFVLGAPGVGFALLTYFTVKEPLRGRLDEDNEAQDSAPDTSLSEVAKLLYGCKSYLYLTLGSVCGGFAGYGFGVWAPTLFVRAFDLSLTEANTRYGAPSVIAGILGAVILGVLADRLSARNPKWPLRLSAIGLTGSGLLMAGIAFAPSPSAGTLLAIPAGLLGGGWVIGVQASLQDLVPAKLRATSTSLWGFAFTFSGLALGVQFAGLTTDLLSAQFGPDAIRYALFTVLLPCVPGSLFLLAATKTMQADRAKILEAC
ncbi:MAG: spinster family MFS transporter [Parvibaculales bacterium]